MNLMTPKIAWKINKLFGPFFGEKWSVFGPLKGLFSSGTIVVTTVKGYLEKGMSMKSRVFQNNRISTKILKYLISTLALNRGFTVTGP